VTLRLFFRLIGAVLCLLAIAMFAVDFLAGNVVERNYLSHFRSELTGRARLLDKASGSDLARMDGARMRSLARAAGGRVTLVDPGGVVLLDSEAEPARMENHRNRPEIAEALAGRDGHAIRHSHTLATDFLYVAIPVSSGALRLAVPLAEVRRQVNSLRLRMLAATALAFLPALAVAAWFSRRLSARVSDIIGFAGELAKGNFGARPLPAGGGHLGLLSGKLNETGENLRRTVAQLDREHAELERLERIRKDFVINVSHELRTPLASIQGYTETLLDGAIDDPDHNLRFLRIIRHNAERLGRLTADLLTLSRVELGRQNFEFAEYEPDELLSEAIDTLRPLAAKKSVAILYAPLPGGPNVYCDPEAVHEIVINLLDNAIKYTPEGGSVTVGAHQSRPGEVEFFVRDTGSGIPSEDLPRLFERFYRVDKGRSRELGGTGLGLAIVKHLVKAQGGEVRVESEPQRGSTFLFTLPAPGESGGAGASTDLTRSST
jgi:two-component system, OmpR family, phosphate regulon sensor histidine kinase PhoR